MPPGSHAAAVCSCVFTRTIANMPRTNRYGRVVFEDLPECPVLCKVCLRVVDGLYHEAERFMIADSKAVDNQKYSVVDRLNTLFCFIRIFLPYYISLSHHDSHYTVVVLKK